MSIDLITMFGNLSQALLPVQRLITGGAYLLGLLFIITALFKFKQIASQGARSGAHDKMFSPMMYLIMGVAFVFLPSTLNLMANTAFGTGNILTYVQFNKIDIRASVIVLIRTVGIIWFIRGCVLVAHASEPGTQHGLKGVLFLISGIFAINFEGSVALINWIQASLLDWTFKKVV